MELWIRSQDENSLIKANNIYSDVLPEDGYYKIFNMPDEDILGKYITKERALEVLDEIQDILDVYNSHIKKHTDMYKNIFVPPCVVYIMPEE